jgi:hypothetical protein
MSPDERTTIIACSVVVGVIVLLLVRCLCSRRSANIASSEWARSLRSAPRIHELAAPLFLPRAMQRGARGARTHMAALVQHTIFAQLATDALIERDAVMDVPDALVGARSRTWLLRRVACWLGGAGALALSPRSGGDRVALVVGG